MMRGYSRILSLGATILLTTSTVFSTGSIVQAETDSGTQVSTDLNEESKSLSSTTIGYQANSEEFSKGSVYQGKFSLQNPQDNTIEVGSKITLSLDPKAIDLSQLNISDKNLQEYFDVKIDSQTGTIEFTLKKEIIGEAKIEFLIRGTVTGDPGSQYPVNVSATDTSGTEVNVTNVNPILKVKEENTIPPAYGFVNMYWGNAPEDVGHFIGPNPEQINGIPTGIFDRNNAVIENFTQINVNGGYELPDDYHYRLTWSIGPTSGNSNINLDSSDISVFDETSNSLIESKFYTVTVKDTANGKVAVLEFQSPKESENAISPTHQLRVTTKVTVDDISLVYHSIGESSVLKEDDTVVDTYSFDLNNIFSDSGAVDLFPVLKASEKTFYVKVLNEDNIESELLKGVTAQDTDDGIISSKVTVNFDQLLPNVDKVGDYEVTYSVTNSKGRTTIKKVIIHIIEREQGKPVTVRYVAQDMTDIIPPEELTGKVEDEYTTTAKDFEGYKLISTPENAKGKFSATPQTVVYKYEGLLVFKEAPTILDFGNHDLSANTETYDLKDLGDNLVVQDFRTLGSSWSMTASLAEAFKGKETGRALDGVLTYINSDGKAEEINGSDTTVIYANETQNHDPVTISSNWLDKKQLRLTVPAGKALADDYEATIEWSLSDRVSND